jgi:hypothetical protein
MTPGTTIELCYFDAAWTLDCEDGTEIGWGGVWSFSPGFALAPARLDYDDVFTDEAMHVHGRLGTHAGSGTASDAFAALTADEQAQFCTTGI